MSRAWRAPLRGDAKSVAGVGAPRPCRCDASSKDLECVAIIGQPTRVPQFRVMGSSVGVPHCVCGLYISWVISLHQKACLPSRLLMSIRSPLELPVPRNATATLQLLQRLVGREKHRHWCGGTIAAEKVPRFLEKMAHRYPAILRNTRERSYDRQRGWAAMHMVLFRPVGSDPGGPPSAFNWWLLSDGGAGGLADPASADAHVAGDAMAANTHLTAYEYVLLYASKRTPHTVTDRRSGCVRRIWTDTSSWSWRIRGTVLAEIRASIDACCRSLALGTEPTEEGAGSGLRGLLAAQRARPLFAGVRNQVIALHRYASCEAWPRYRSAWLAGHVRLAAEHGPAVASLPGMRELLAVLPTMRQLRTYDAPVRSIRDLLGEP